MSLLDEGSQLLIDGSVSPMPEKLRFSDLLLSLYFSTG